MASLNSMVIFIGYVIMLAYIRNPSVIAEPLKLRVSVESSKESTGPSMGRLLPGIISNPSPNDEYIPECDGVSGCNNSPESCGEECLCDGDLDICYAPSCHVNQTCEDGGICDPECDCIEPDMFCNTRH